jgi:hypothetical protein
LVGIGSIGYYTRHNVAGSEIAPDPGISAKDVQEEQECTLPDNVGGAKGCH